MRGLGAYIFLDQGICRLSVKAESIFEGLHIGAFFEKSFLQPIASGMEVLLQKKGKRERTDPLTFMISQGQQKLWNTMANSSELTHNIRRQLSEKQPTIMWTVCILQGGANT